MADHLPSEPAVAALFSKLASFLPGFAGSVLSLAFVEALTVRGRALAVLVGLCAVVWISPALAAGTDLVWPGTMPSEIRSAIQFLTGLCAMGCLPELLRWMKRVAGDPLSLLKVRVGPIGGGN